MFWEPEGQEDGACALVLDGYRDGVGIDLEVTAKFLQAA